MNCHNKPTRRGMEWKRWREDHSFVSRYDKRYVGETQKPKTRTFIIKGKKVVKNVDDQGRIIDEQIQEG